MAWRESKIFFLIIPENELDVDELRQLLEENCERMKWRSLSQTDSLLTRMNVCEHQRAHIHIPRHQFCSLICFNSKIPAAAAAGGGGGERRLTLRIHILKRFAACSYSKHSRAISVIFLHSSSWQAAAAPKYLQENVINSKHTQKGRDRNSFFMFADCETSIYQSVIIKKNINFIFV
jgi:hypothetical protein